MTFKTWIIIIAADADKSVRIRRILRLSTQGCKLLRSEPMSLSALQRSLPRQEVSLYIVYQAAKFYAPCTAVPQRKTSFRFSRFSDWCRKCLSLSLSLSLFSVISNRSTGYSMSSCAGSLSWWGPLQRGDLCRGFSQLLIDVWLLVNEVSTLTLNLLTTQTMVTTGIIPPQGKSPW